MRALIDQAGIRIVEPSSSPSGAGSSGLGLAVNALHIEFTNAVLGLGLMNGEIVIAHSDAALSRVVPEPSLALLGLLSASAARGATAGSTCRRC